VAPDRFTAPQSVREIFGADLFYSWEAFAEANLVSPYHVVFIHNSIFEQVDLTWTNWAYRNQIMLVGFSMPFDRIIALTGDQCITEINKGIWDDVEETITFYTYSIQLEDERYRAQIDERKLIYCDEQFDLNDTSAGLSKGSSLCGITRIEDLTSLVSRIITTRMNQQLTAHPIRVHPRLLPLVPASLNPISTPTP
ncbi:MAG: hypothetical protein MUF87_17020, partial [Anaerolineae bacterium]|nr:hypothetical protein [Anaerolineae bacterium]